MVSSAPPRILRDIAPTDGAVQATLGAFEELGIAVFPQRLRKKGTWAEGWPTKPIAEALSLSRAQAGQGQINLAGRTGAGVGVLDLDAKSGLDPDELLRLLLPRVEPALIAVVKTGRGYHLWLAVSDSVGNGFCSAIGGEVFSEPHLAMLPPSIHPEGHQYTWVVEPHQPLEKVDLRALGLVPDQAAGPASRNQNKREPAPPQVQAEFAALMAEAGVQRVRGVQELTRCPWHDDKHASLSINWEVALLHCFADGCPAHGGGGLGKLRQLLGRHTPTYRQEEPWLPTTVNSGCVEEEAERLAEVLGRLGLVDKARRVRDCKKRFLVGRCTSCGISPAFPLACKHPLCPRCMPGRLAADWLEHRQDLPTSLTFLRLRPRDFWGTNVGVLKKVRSRFNEWRKRSDIGAGIYGLRLEASGAVVLLALPTRASVPQASRAFDVEVVAEGQSSEAFLRWLQAEYADEARAWETDEDLGRLLEETRGRRRFQGFGEAYGAEKTSPADGATEHAAEPASDAVPLRKISGGSHSAAGKRDVRLCPFCGAKVEMLSFSVPIEEVRLINGSHQWTGPPGREAAA